MRCLLRRHDKIAEDSVQKSTIVILHLLINFRLPIPFFNGTRMKRIEQIFADLFLFALRKWIKADS